MKKVYNKLVQDYIHDICRRDVKEPVTLILSDKEYWELLLKKVLEKLEKVIKK